MSGPCRVLDLHPRLRDRAAADYVRAHLAFREQPDRHHAILRMRALNRCAELNPLLRGPLLRLPRP